MTFEQIFTGRLILMRAQRHVCQGNRYRLGKNHGLFFPIFEDKAADEAFLIVEWRLIELEREFEQKRNRAHRSKRQSLDRRADRQVEAIR